MLQNRATGEWLLLHYRQGAVLTRDVVEGAERIGQLTPSLKRSLGLREVRRDASQAAPQNAGMEAARRLRANTIEKRLRDERASGLRHQRLRAECAR